MSLTRRDFLKGVAGTAAAATLPAISNTVSAAPAALPEPDRFVAIRYSGVGGSKYWRRFAVPTLNELMGENGLTKAKKALTVMTAGDVQFIFEEDGVYHAHSVAPDGGLTDSELAAVEADVDAIRRLPLTTVDEVVDELTAKAIR